jgi:hypothetical protein
MNALLGLGFFAALVMAFARSTPSSVINVKAGETWMLVARAVGAKLTQAQADQWHNQMDALATVNSIFVNGAGDTVTMVLTYKVDTHILMNLMIAPIPTDPTKGVMITEAKRQN